MTHGTEPPYDPDNEDMSEVACCRHCGELITPGKEVDWNDWFWHASCVPSHVLYGREMEQRADEARGK